MGKMTTTVDASKRSGGSTASLVAEDMRWMKTQDVTYAESCDNVEEIGTLRVGVSPLRVMEEVC
jgi:hypothetical protein